MQLRFSFSAAQSAAAIVALLAASSAVALPTPDHILIVIEENHSPENIIGSADAPYINSLAAAGANFNNFFAITHPSQPNYLQLYSGSNQGVIDNTVPAPGAPFTTANLGAALLAAGKTFGIYSEDLPAVGSTVTVSGAYARRHNPVVNWQSNNPGVNQYGPSLNMPLTSFPSNFSQLPTVSFVVPNNANNMHDGTIATADAWLRTNIKPYADWAQTHNSLLVVTWDEDEIAGRNRIPTIFSGPMVRQSQQAATWTLHNLLRTVEEMYGTTHAGNAKSVKPIVGPFNNDPELITARFQQGAGGYAGTSDTYIDSASANTVRGNDTSAAVTSSGVQGLVRFDSIFGNGAGQAPVGAKILSAKLLLTTTVGEFSNETIALHGMLSNWTESSTWNSLGGGVSSDDAESESIAEFRVIPNVQLAPGIFDVSRSIQKWADDPALNKGWLLRGGTPADLWRWRSSEHATLADRPMLEIAYERPHWGLDANGLWSSSGNWISGLPTGAGAKANFLRAISAPRTVAIDGPVTVGSLMFDSEIPYTLAGSRITLTPLPGVPSTINVLAGAHMIVADVNLQDEMPITISEGARLEITGPLTIAAGKTIDKSGAGGLHATGGISSTGVATVNAREGRLEAKYLRGLDVSIAAGVVVAIPHNGTSLATSKLHALSIDGTPAQWLGQLDLGDNAMIVQADSASSLQVLERIAGQIASGRNSGPGRWSGQGITSSSAAASGGVMGLAVLLNDNGAGGVLYSNFFGQPADLDSILVTYTLVGDMNGDGDIDADDFAKIDAGFAQQLDGYWNGDLDYNGRIDADDFFLIDRAFSSAANPPHPAFAANGVPEPAAVGIGLLISAILSLRQRRMCFSTPSSPAPARDSP